MFATWRLVWPSAARHPTTQILVKTPPPRWIRSVPQVSEQVDSLRVLATDPVDYLVTPRVLASMLAGPVLNVLCFCMGARGGSAWSLSDRASLPWLRSSWWCGCVVLAHAAACPSMKGHLVRPQSPCLPPTATGIGASVLLADLVYNVPANVILDSARRALTGYDVITSCIKAWAFSTAISVVRPSVAVLRMHAEKKEGEGLCGRALLHQPAPTLHFPTTSDLVRVGVHDLGRRQGRGRIDHQRCRHQPGHHLCARLPAVLRVLSGDEEVGAGRAGGGGGVEAPGQRWWRGPTCRL